jgi:hypothetical protein
MSRFLLAALFAGATFAGLATSANAASELGVAVAAPAPAAHVLTVAEHCGPGRHYVRRYEHHGHWMGGYCTRHHEG